MESFFDQSFHIIGLRTDCPDNFSCFCNDVMLGACLKLADGHDGRLIWIGVSADDGLQCIDYLCADNDCVHCIMRHGSMSARSFDNQFETVGVSHDWSGHD